MIFKDRTQYGITTETYLKRLEGYGSCEEIGMYLVN